MGLAGGLLDNRTLLEKADLALSDLTTGGGLLQPAQAQKFIRILIKESVILKQCTVVPMKSPKQLIEKIRFGSRILRAADQLTPLAPADRSKPDLTHVELDAQLFKAEVRLSNEVLEDSIERGQLRQTIMQLMAEAISRDMEEVIVSGDTNNSDPFLAKLNGVLKQATSHLVDAQGQRTNKNVFRDMLKSMPSEFLRNKRALQFFTSVESELDYRDSIAERATPLGDRAFEQGDVVVYSGVPVTDVPLFPENLGPNSNTTNSILTDPKNINVGIWRNIRIETDKLIQDGVLLVVATLRFDARYAEETAVVKALNIRVGS
jgi:hypothetical protein